MAKKSMIAKNKRLVVKNVVVHIQFTANLNFAVFASVN